MEPLKPKTREDMIKNIDTIVSTLLPIENERIKNILNGDPAYQDCRTSENRVLFNTVFNKLDEIKDYLQKEDSE